LLSVFNIFAQDNESFEQHFNLGKTLYDSANYLEALDEFNKAMETAPEAFKPKAHIITGYCYMSLNKYDKAEITFDYIIENYSDSQEYFEAMYQKGRVNFINENYETAIDILNQFIDSAENNPFRGNAFFWIAESLYNLGHFNEAAAIYKVVTEKYKDSFRFDAAKNRIELINLSKREREIEKLLKWSFEESINEREQFKKQEEEYNQAILAYQRKLTLLSEDDKSKLVLSMQEANDILIKQIEVNNEEKQKIIDEKELLEKDMAELKTNVVSLNSEIENLKKIIEEKNTFIDNLNKIIEQNKQDIADLNNKIKSKKENSETGGDVLF
jgi:tetratricopeptide (TPR) repeat protein